MITAECLSFLFFVTLGSGAAVRNENCQKLSDPLGPIRESCRKQVNLTRDQLKCIENDPETLGKYVACFGQFVGDHNVDGTINRDALLKAVPPMIPSTIVGAITDRCLYQVYHGEKPNSHEILRLYADFTICWKNGLGPSMWNLLGVFAPPVHSTLDTCLEW